MTGPARPPLSIVVPTRDTRDLTLACLAAVARSHPPGTEVVLVDDASSDGTPEAIETVAARHPEVEVLRLAEPCGFGRAANRGLERARGEVLLLLNSDTEVEPGALAALVARFAAQPRLGIAGATLHYPDGSPQWSGGGAPSLLWLFGLASGLPALLGRLPLWRRAKPLAAPGEVDWVTGAALAMRRDVWEAIGPLDEGFRFYGQDLDLCLRARSAGWTVAVLPEVRVLHHHGATIGRTGDASPGGQRQPPELLWLDLLRWAAAHRGPGWARRARAALTAGAAVRILARRAAIPFVPRERRGELQAGTAAFARARAALATAGRGAGGGDGEARRTAGPR